MRQGDAHVHAVRGQGAVLHLPEAACGLGGLGGPVVVGVARVLRIQRVCPRWAPPRIRARIRARTWTWTHDGLDDIGDASSPASQYYCYEYSHAHRL